MSGILLSKCPGCYSSRSSPVYQCHSCGHVRCNRCKVGGGIFTSSTCPKCGVKYASCVGKIK